VHIFHRMRKEAIQFFAYTGKHLANYSQKLSIISKQSKLIPKELRYQEKYMQLSNMLREKISCKFSPNFILFYLFFLKKMQYGKDIICKARSNLMMPIQNNSCSTCFFCLPQQVPAMLSQENRGHNKLVSRLHSKHINITSKSVTNQT
jgi:hypothetical protein